MWGGKGVSDPLILPLTATISIPGISKFLQLQTKCSNRLPKPPAFPSPLLTRDAEEILPHIGRDLNSGYQGQIVNIINLRRLVIPRPPRTPGRPRRLGNCPDLCRNKAAQPASLLCSLPLPLWCECGRRRTCPAEASAAPPYARSLGCAPPDAELPCRSPPGHIPLSEPAALPLLGACPHWCKYSASNDSEGKSTCSHKPSFAPSPSTHPGLPRAGRGRRAQSSLIWHGGAQRPAHPPPLGKPAACVAAWNEWALARCLLRPWDFSQVGRAWKDTRRHARIPIPWPRALTPYPYGDPSLPSHLRL